MHPVACLTLNGMQSVLVGRYMFENVAKTKIKKFNIGLFSWRLSPPDIRITSLNCIFQFTASLMLALNLLKAFENFCLVWVR